MRLQISVELLLSEIDRIEAGARRLRLIAEEGPVVLDRVPRTEERIEFLEQPGVVPRDDLGAKPVVIGRVLALVNLAHQIGGLVEQVDDLALLSGEVGGVDRHVDRGELGEAVRLGAVGRLVGGGLIAGGRLAGGKGENQCGSGSEPMGLGHGRGG